MHTRGFGTTSSKSAWALPTRLMLALLVLGAAVFLAACDGGEGDAGDDEPTAASTAESTATPGGGGGEEGRVAQAGDTVSLHYRGTLDDGTEFDSSAGREPLTFTVGSGQVIQGFDDAVVGMAVGEKKTFRLEPEQAYGERREDLIITVPAENAPEGLQAGQQVALGNAPATVVRVEENGDVVVDANHRLAGEALTFDIEVVSID